MWLSHKELLGKAQYVGTISSSMRWMSGRRVMISYGITVVSRAGPTQDGLKQGFLLIRLPAGAVKLRMASEDMSPRSPKPDLSSELNHCDGLSGRQHSPPCIQSRPRGRNIVYLSICLWTKYIESTFWVSARMRVIRSILHGHTA